MSSQFTRQCLERIVAQICKSIGWDSVNQSCYEILVDILHNHMKMLCTLLHDRAEACNRTEPGLLDINYYLHTSNIFDIYRLGEYIRDVHIPPALPNLPQYPVKLNQDKTDLPPLNFNETTRKFPPAETTTSNVSSETQSDETPHSTNPERKDEVIFAEVNTNEFLRIVLYINKHVLILASRNSEQLNNEVDSTKMVKEVPKEASNNNDSFEFKRPKTPKTTLKKHTKCKIQDLHTANSCVKKELLNEADYQSNTSEEVDKSLNYKKHCKKEQKTNSCAGSIPEIKQEILDMCEVQTPTVEVEESHKISPPKTKVKRATKSKSSRKKQPSVESLAVEIKQEVFDDFCQPEELHPTIPVTNNIKKSKKRSKKEQSSTDSLISNNFADIKQEITDDPMYEITEPKPELRKMNRQPKKGKKTKKNCKKEPLPVEPMVGHNFLYGSKEIKQEPLDDTYEIKPPTLLKSKNAKKTKKSSKKTPKSRAFVNKEIKQELFDDICPVKRPKLEPEESHTMNPYAKRSKRNCGKEKYSAESLVLNNAAVISKKIKQELLDDIGEIKPEESYKVNPYATKKRSKKVKYSVKSLLTENKLILKRLH